MNTDEATLGKQDILLLLLLNQIGVHQSNNETILQV